MSLYERILSDVVGTLKSVFSIGKHTLFKSTSGMIEVKDFDDSEYIDLKSQRIILDDNAGKQLVIDVDFATSGGYVPQFDIKEYSFSHSTSSPYLLTTVDVGQRVKKVILKIEEAFELGTTISVGHTGNPNGLMATTDNIPTIIQSWEVAPEIKYDGSDQIKLYITGTSSTGSGYVFLEIENTL